MLVTDLTNSRSQALIASNQITYKARPIKYIELIIITTMTIMMMTISTDLAKCKV